MQPKSRKTRRQRELAGRKTLAIKRDMQPFEYRSVCYWSKEINGTRTGGRKGKFFNSRPTVLRWSNGGRACGTLSIPAEEVSLGSPRAGTIHVHAPTPHTPPLQAFLADFSQQTTRFSHLLAMVCFQSSPRALGCCIDGVCGTVAYPLPDLPREASRSRSATTKSV